jgi:two-component system, cell cycle sensor histidine kinase and response regulator CckA
MDFRRHNFLRDRLLRHVFLISVLVAIALPVYNVYYVFPSFTSLLIESTKEDAVRVANHLASLFFSDISVLKKEHVTAELLHESRRILTDFDLMRFKVFSPSGEVLFSTSPEDTGTVNRKAYFRDIVAKGKAYAVFVEKGGKSLEEERVQEDVVETYVPIMRGSRFIGAFEIYYDVTARRGKLAGLLSHSSYVLLALALSLLCIIVLVLLRENRHVLARIAAEETLKESEGRYRTAIEQSHDGVVILKGDTLFYANQKYIEIFGYDKSEEVVGRSVSITIHPDDRSRVLDINWKRQAGEPVPSHYEFRGIKKNGEAILIEVSATRTVYHGEVVSVVYLRDVTSRKALEAELFRSRNLESIGMLAGGIAHDFNNLLAAVIGHIALARMYVEVGSKTDEVLKAGERAALVGKDLTRQLLTFSRGGDPLRKIIDITTLIKDATEICLKGTDIVWKYSLPNHPLLAEVDVIQLRHVVHGVLTNAKEAMPEGGSVTVGAARVILENGTISSVPAGDYVMVFVQDQGVGVPQEHLIRMFDPYFTTKDRGAQKGMGLGLAITHSIVKKHNGFIKIESEPGVGTTVRIYLPARAEVEKEKTEDAEPVGGGARKRILVVDEDVTLRVVTVEILKKLGYDVAFARTGTEAAELYARALQSLTRFDGVILDLIGPGGMGGIETIRRLLEMDPDARVIVSSGYSDDPIIADYAAYGFKGAIPKPYGIDELKEMLEKISA